MRISLEIASAVFLMLSFIPWWTGSISGLRRGWTTDWQDMVFAGSSHTNPNAPARFVLRLTER